MQTTTLHTHSNSNGGDGGRRRQPAARRRQLHRRQRRRQKQQPPPADGTRCGLLRTQPGDQKLLTAVSGLQHLRVVVLVSELSSHFFSCGTSFEGWIKNVFVNVLLGINAYLGYIQCLRLREVGGLNPLRSLERPPPALLNFNPLGGSTQTHSSLVMNGLSLIITHLSPSVTMHPMFTSILTAFSYKEKVNAQQSTKIRLFLDQKYKILAERGTAPSHRRIVEDPSQRHIQHACLSSFANGTRPPYLAPFGQFEHWIIMHARTFPTNSYGIALPGKIGLWKSKGSNNLLCTGTARPSVTYGNNISGVDRAVGNRIRRTTYAAPRTCVTRRAVICS